MEIHISEVGEKRLAWVRKCIPVQQKGDKHYLFMGPGFTPKNRVKFEGKLVPIIFSCHSYRTESARMHVCRQYRAMSVHQICANHQIGFIQMLTPWYFH